VSKNLNAILLAILTLACNVNADASENQPNILFIFADDLSYETIGAHGLLDTIPRLKKAGSSGKKRSEKSAP